MGDYGAEPVLRRAYLPAGLFGAVPVLECEGRADVHTHTGELGSGGESFPGAIR